MSFVVEKIENFSLSLDSRKVFLRIGCRKQREDKIERVKVLIDKEKEKLTSLLEPKAVYTILDYNETNKHHIFKNAEKVGLSLCTIGYNLEKECTELTERNEILRALILDVWGSETVEEIANQVDRIISKKARQMNLWPSKRFSPGYGIWDIKEQKFIFNVLPSKEIGIELTKSFIMIPQKSVSFRINFYRDRNLSTKRI